MKKLILLFTAIVLLAGCSTTPEAPVLEIPAPQTTEDSASYEDYSPERYSELKGQKPFALFFHAKWCGECKSLEKELTGNLSSYPEDIIILKTDYDTETNLRNEFDVKVQTTFVIFDAQGNVVVNKPIFEAKDVIAEMTQVL
ncbi:MAG: thioredoxin domain-containing protein [Patescibacteria group bacterium]